ncbi:MAG: hypothetical protein M3Z35_04505 [Nitrospirota bacterium]|nr:hypothetical protein [Nitrospirota bacterium]
MSEPFGKNDSESLIRDQEFKIEIQPHDAENTAAARLADELVHHRAVSAHLQSTNPELATFELLDKDGGDEARFEAVIYDPDHCRSVRINGQVSDVGRATAHPIAHARLPRDEEFQRAVESVLRDDRLGLSIERDGVQAYRPMPPYVDIQSPDGSVERMITVGLRTQAGGVRHRIVGVLADGSVVVNPEGVPHSTASDCEPPAPRGGCDTAGGRDQVHVRVIQGATVLWDFILVRPRASSGTNGSGVELRFVDYKGERVLYRAHVPILNVEYGAAGVAGGCGPTYRDWQNQEWCFKANGSDPVGPGFRVCTTPPQTILESGVDGGNFAGVALWYDGRELRLVSQLAAGWYRYISDWRLRNDGSIGPRFGFAGTLNPCTCDVHTHHAYWRLDFDIMTAGNNIVEEYNKPPIVAQNNWHTKKFEIRRPRDAGHQRHWRVRNKGTFRGYTLTPGQKDGAADGYGVGDLWVLRYHGNEIDDGQGFTTNPGLSRANIDKFVDGESIDGQDVVLWYAGHFMHDESNPAPGGHVVGPELRPFNW